MITKNKSLYVFHVFIFHKPNFIFIIYLSFYIILPDRVEAQKNQCAPTNWKPNLRIKDLGGCK